MFEGYKTVTLHTVMISDTIKGFPYIFVSDLTCKEEAVALAECYNQFATHIDNKGTDRANLFAYVEENEDLVKI